MAASEEQLLSLEDVASRLQVSDQTVRRWIKSGKLAAYKPGLEWRIKPKDLEAFLQARSSPKEVRRSSLEPTLFTYGLEDERRLDYENVLATLYRGLAQRARRIVEKSRREGPSPELTEDLTTLQNDERALIKLRGRRDLFGKTSEVLADAEDAYEEQAAIIQAMLRQDVEASDEERDTARRFRPADKIKRRKADAS